MDEPYKHDGIRYFTSENFYQAMKIPANRRNCASRLLQYNLRNQRPVFENPDRYYVRDDWTTDEKLRMMREILAFKFAPNTSWYRRLLETVSEEIVEYNNRGDDFWGVDIRKIKGQNHLGKILMKMREGFTRIDLDTFMS